MRKVASHQQNPPQAMPRSKTPTVGEGTVQAESASLEQESGDYSREMADQLYENVWQGMTAEPATAGDSSGGADGAAAPLVLQPRLEIGSPDNRYEQEADRVADQVVQRLQSGADEPKPNSQASLQRQISQGDSESLSRTISLKPATPAVTNGGESNSLLHLKPVVQRLQEQASASSQFESSVERSRSGGQPMSETVQSSMGEAFGADFSGVRIHHDAESDQLSRSIQAKAFTTGQDIFFRQGAYEPGSSSGQHLLAHELTHVVQQNGPGVQRKPATTTISRQISPQISRSPANEVQRLVWAHEQLKTRVQDKVKKDTFGKNEAEKKIVELMALLKEYEVKVDRSIEDSSEESDTGRIDCLKRLQGLTVATRQVTQPTEVEVNEALTDFEQSILDEQRGLEKKVDARKSGDQKALNEADDEVASSSIEMYYEYAYSELVYNPIYSAVCLKLGLNRGEWRRSDKLNEFRNSLKQAARSQAYEDIDSLIAEQLQAVGKDSEAAQEYYGNKAKVEAYTTAKTDVVNKVVEEVAHEITKGQVGKDKVLPRFKQVVLGELIKAQNQPKKKPPTADALKSVVNDAAKEIVKEQVGKTKGDNASEAIVIAREITKGTSQESQEKREDLIDQVKNVTKKSGVAKKAIQTAITEDSLDKGFQRIGRLIDFAVPTPGTSCEVDIQVKIPVYSGTYITIQVKGSAEKDQEEGAKPELEAGLEITLGAGWSALGIDVNAQAGFYFKSTAEDSAKLMGLVSYGFYRQLPDGVAHRLWGAGGSKLAGIEKSETDPSKKMTEGEGRKKMAEGWASMMEEWLFYERDPVTGQVIMEDDPQSGQKKPKLNEAAAIEMGGMAKANVKAGIGEVGDLEVGLSYQQGRKISAGTFSEKDSSGNETSTIGKKKTQEQINKVVAGQTRKTVKLEASFDIKALDEAFGVSAEVSYNWVPDNIPAPPPPAQKPDPLLPYSFEVEVAGKLSTKLGGPGVWQKVIASIGGSLTNLIKKVADEKQKSSSTGGSVAEGAGDVAFIAGDIGGISGEAGESLGGQLVDVFGKRDDDFTGEMENVMEAKQAFELALGFERSREKAGEAAENELSVSLSRVREIGFDTGVVSAKAESKSRIAKFSKKF